MKIEELSAPIVAAKADWLIADDWIGFTPTDASGPAREQCRSTIARQCHGGYVLEYVTLTHGTPNIGFGQDQRYLQERARHREAAGRLVAVHKLLPTARPLGEIIGINEFERIQAMWATGVARYRWSVAFPIVESFDIIERPLASEVFDSAAMRRLFAHPSATLRPLKDRERLMIRNLVLRSKTVRNSEMNIERELEMAERSTLPITTLRNIERDLSGAVEGLSRYAMGRRRKRAAWLAQKFIKERMNDNRLLCDDCGFDPHMHVAESEIPPKSLLDVHHKFPLCEGERYTTMDDFELLCPTCHRLEHARLKIGQSRHEHAIQ